MRVESLTALVLIAALFTCTYDPDAAVAVDIATEPGAGLDERSAAADPDLFDFDIVQRTCALEVVMRRIAREGHLAFGYEIDDTPLRPELNTGGAMLACVAAPTTIGDTARVGVRWR